jgi:hypothetical protein
MACCQVIALAMCILIQISVTLLNMTDACLLQSFSSNSTSLYCYENYMDDDDYVVVMDY